MRRAVLAGLVAIAAGLVSAQEPVQGPTVSVETNLVVVPVTVVDSHGAVVSGLSADRFAVYDEGRPQPIDFFTNEDVPATIGLVIDCSSSMRGHREEVTAAATAFAAISHPLDEMFTMNFNEYVWPGSSEPFTLASEFEPLRAALADAPARGMTALYDGLYRALQHLQLGKRDRKVLIVISDGGDNASGHTFEETMAYAKRMNTVIYSVLVFNRDDHDAKPGVLKALAKETGGSAFTPRGPQDMTKIFTQIALEIRGAYTIGFTPPSAVRDGFRPIRVMVRDADRRQLTVRSRTGYYATPPRRVK